MGVKTSDFGQFENKIKERDALPLKVMKIC